MRHGLAFEDRITQSPMEKSLRKQHSESSTSGSPHSLLDLDVLAQLVADGESPIPDDLAPDELRTLLEKVRSVRRHRLLGVLAGIVADSLEKSEAFGDFATHDNAPKIYDKSPKV